MCAADGCDTVLSQYNPDAFCSVHSHAAVMVQRQRVVRHGEPLTRTCDNPGCRRQFTTHNPARRYCSDKCRVRAFQLRRAASFIQQAVTLKGEQIDGPGETLTRTCANPDCGHQFATQNPRRKYCSSGCRIRAFQLRHAQDEGLMPTARPLPEPFDYEVALASTIVSAAKPLLLTFEQVRDAGVFAWRPDRYLYMDGRLLREVGAGSKLPVAHADERRLVPSVMKGDEAFLHNGWRHLHDCSCFICAHHQSLNQLRPAEV